jgi:hypothetical protein
MGRKVEVEMWVGAGKGGKEWGAWRAGVVAGGRGF